MNGIRSFSVSMRTTLLTIFVAMAVAMPPVVSAQADAGDRSCSLLAFRELLSAVTADSAIETIEAGVTMSARFTVENTSSFIIPKSTLMAVLVPAEAAMPGAVRPVYASAVLLDSVTITTDFSRVIDATLPVPSNIETGLYELVLVAAQSQDDVVSMASVITDADILASVPVSVLGNEASLILENDISVAGTKSTLAESVLFDTREPFPVALTVSNLADNAAARGILSWELYEGSIPTPNALVATEQFEVKLVPEASKAHTLRLQHSDTDSATDPIAAERLSFDRYLLIITLSNDTGVIRRVPLAVVREDSEEVVTDTQRNVLLAESVEGGTQLIGCIAPQYANHSFLDTASFLTVTSGGSEVGSTLRVGEDHSDSDSPLTLIVGPTQGQLEVVFAHGRGSAEVASVPTFSRKIISGVTVVVGCDIHSCVMPAEPVSTAEPVSPLKTAVGIAILFIIACLPILGAYQVIRRSRAKKKSIMDDSDNEMHPLDIHDEDNQR